MICGTNSRNKPMGEKPGELLYTITFREEAVLNAPGTLIFPIVGKAENQKT
jgi:hypothetical protein